MRKIQAIKELPEGQVKHLEDYIFYAIDILWENVKYLKRQKELAKINELDKVEIHVQNFVGEPYSIRRVANLMDAIFDFDHEDPMHSFPEDVEIQNNTIFQENLAAKRMKTIYYYE
jgi:hypothetical protein